MKAIYGEMITGIGVIIGVIIVALTTFLTVAILMIMKGFVLFKLWIWFIVPIFGLAPLNIPQILGLTTIASYMTMHDLPRKEERSTWNQLGICIFHAGIVLLAGWVIHLFM